MELLGEPSNPQSLGGTEDFQRWRRRGQGTHQTERNHGRIFYDEGGGGDDSSRIVVHALRGCMAGMGTLVLSYSRTLLGRLR